MARVYPKRRSDPPIKVQGTRGFPLGLNELTHPSAIKNNELSECKNAIFDQNGVVKKRQGTDAVSTTRDEDNTKIIGLQGVYDINGDSFVLRIASDGILQKYSDSTDTWSDVSGSPTFDDDFRTYIIQGYGYVYFMNEGNILAKWDGSAWTTFAALTNPVTAPTCTKKGSGTGPRTYYYKYIYFNSIGYTEASNAGSVASMPETLDTSTYIEVAVPAAPENCTSIGIFRGLEPGQERYLNKIPATETIYNDQFQADTDETYSTPSGNTTSGYHFKFGTVFKDTILGVTTELGDDVIVFSGGLDAFDTFAISEGGGYIAWRKGDGSKLTCLKPFKEELYVFKVNKIGAFKFDTTSGAATIRDINFAIGAVSQDAVHEAGNDLRGYSLDGVFSFGNEPNFADVVRSKLLSPRVQKTIDSVTKQDILGIVSVYMKNLSIWAIPSGSAGDGNTNMLVYDERYAGWSLWTGLKASCFTKYIDADNIEHLYYGEATSGNVIEMFVGTNDQGTAINFSIATKQFDMGTPYKYKTYSRCYLLFGLVTGMNTRISMLGNGIEAIGTYPLYIQSNAIGFGTDEWGSMDFGDSSDTAVVGQRGIIIKYIDLSNRDYFNIQSIINNNGLNDQVEIMGIFFEYSESERPLASTYRLNKI